MWCGGFASTRIHETVRHTWQFDFDSSNSFAVVLSSAAWNMSSRKKSVFVFFCFCFLAFVPGCLARHFSGALCCVVLFCVLCFFPPPGVVCFISQAIWLVSESNFAPVLLCTPPSPPSPHTHTHIHTFPQTDTPPSHSKQINSSLAALGKPQCDAAAHNSPETCRLLLMFLVHLGSRRLDTDFPTTICLCVCVCVWRLWCRQW